MIRRFAVSSSGVVALTGDAQTANEKSDGRFPLDSLRLEVAAIDPAITGGEFELLIFVNDVELTSIGAGMGMDPYYVLIPTNKLVASAQPHTVPIARCDCGIYGCGATDATIARRGGLVHWDWLYQAPIDRSVQFDATEYDREIARVASDHSWETPERTAGRLVLTDIDRDHLLTYGLTPQSAGNDRYNPRMFWVALQLDDDYQVLVDTPWLDRSPQQLAAAVCAALAQPPEQWIATWRAINPSRRTSAPTIAGKSWRRDGL
jgi:hypothetical protein